MEVNLHRVYLWYIKGYKSPYSNTRAPERKRLQHCRKTGRYMYNFKETESTISVARKQLEDLQESKMTEIVKWFKSWKSTEAAKTYREVTNNFTRIYFSPKEDTKSEMNGHRVEIVDEYWTRDILTTPAAWRVALDLAFKVATPKGSSKTDGMTNKEAVEAMEVVKAMAKKTHDWDVIEEAADLMNAVKNRRRYDEIVTLKLKISKILESMEG